MGFTRNSDMSSGRKWRMCRKWPPQIPLQEFLNKFTAIYCSMSSVYGKILSCAIVVCLSLLTFAGFSYSTAVAHSGNDSGVLAADASMLFGVKNSSSLNWAGYAVTSSADSFSNVSGSFVVPDPPVSSSSTQHSAVFLSLFSHYGKSQKQGPSSPTSYAAFWAGIDGYNDNTVEQAGVLMEVSGGSATYSAWYEFYPSPPVYASWKPAAGDVIAVYVNYTSSGFTAKVIDMTSSKSFTSPTTNVSGAQRASAEWIAEAPSSQRGILPLADFGTVYFGYDYTSVKGTNNATVSGSSYTIGTLASDGYSVYAISMVNRNGSLKAAPSPLSFDGTSFSVKWYSS